MGELIKTQVNEQLEYSIGSSVKMKGTNMLGTDMKSCLDRIYSEVFVVKDIYRLEELDDKIYVEVGNKNTEGSFYTFYHSELKLKK